METRRTAERDRSPFFSSRLAMPLKTLAFALLLLWLPLGALGQGEAPSADPNQAMRDKVAEGMKNAPTGEEAVNQILTEMDARLTLSDEQKNEIRPILLNAGKDMKKIADRFMAKEITPMAMGMQMQMEIKKTATLIDPFLDEKQQTEYQAMLQEQRRKMMDRMRKGMQGANP